MSLLIPNLPEGSLNMVITGLAFRLANRAVLSDIESEGIRTEIEGTVWWDILPMVNLNEHSAEVIDMVTEALAYALGCELIVQHPNVPHLVRANPAYQEPHA